MANLSKLVFASNIKHFFIDFIPNRGHFLNGDNSAKLEMLALNYFLIKKHNVEVYIQVRFLFLSGTATLQASFIKCRIPQNIDVSQILCNPVLCLLALLPPSI